MNVDAVREIIDGADEVADQDAVSEPNSARRSTADRLVNYALASKPTLFLDQHGAAHALVEGTPVRLSGRSAKATAWLRRLLWDREQRTASSDVLSTAVGTLAAHAEYSGDSRTLHVRSAWCNDALYIELRPGRVLRVTASRDGDGWQIDPSPPVLFRQYPNTRPLPDPVYGGDIDSLLELTNIKLERQRRLVRAYIETAYLEHIARPILDVNGAMGSGKTTLCRLIKRVIDPGAPESVRLDPRDSVQKAAHCAVLFVDNASSFADWAVDFLCRLVTGEADSKRVLYTDDDDQIYELQRLVLTNGINPPADRSDYRDRVLALDLERIPDQDRKPEAALWATLDREHPRWLGAIFTTLSRVLLVEPKLEVGELPRLADWGRYAAAAYVVHEWGVKQFRADWLDAVADQQRAAIDGSPVAQAVVALMADRNQWEGSSGQLHADLAVQAERLRLNTRDRLWPSSPSWLWRRIREVTVPLAALGITTIRREKAGSTQITLTGAASSENAATAATPPTVSSNGRSDDGSIVGGRADAATVPTDAATPSRDGNGSNSSNGSIFGGTRRVSVGASNGVVRLNCVRCGESLSPDELRDGRDAHIDCFAATGVV